MRVAGLDPSLTGYGIAVRVDDGCLPLLVRLAPRIRGHERLEYLLTEVGRHVEGCDLAVIEGVVNNGVTSFGTLMDLAGLGWLTRHLLWRLGIPYAVMPPPNLKQFATGSARADKVAMALAAQKRFPRLEITDSDVADALWLCAAGCQYAGEPAADLPQAQVAILTAVHAEKRKRGQPKIAWPQVLGNCGPRPEPETGVLFTREAV